MDFINLNFEVRNKNLNSDDKKDKKTKKDISHSENIPTNLAKPTGELLKAYSNVVSFKGDNVLDKQIREFSQEYKVFPNNRRNNSNNVIRNIVFSFNFDTSQFNVNKEESERLNNIDLSNAETREKFLSDMKSKINRVEEYASRKTKETFDNVVKTAILAESLDVSSDSDKLNQIYKLITLKVPTTENAVETSRNLTSDELKTCLSFDITSDEDINEFIELQNKELKQDNGTSTKLNLSEAAILTKRAADDSVVDRYLTIKSKSNIEYTDSETSEKKTYNLSFYERLLLAETNFDLKKIPRYVAIKTLPIEIEGVRQQTRTINLTVEQALKYAESEKQDDEIKSEFRLYELVSKGIDMNSATIISQSEDLMNMMKEVDSDGKLLYTPEEVVKIAKLGFSDRQQYEVYRQLQDDKDVDENTALKIAKTGKIENIETYKNLMVQGLSVDDAIKISDCEKTYERYQNLLNSQTHISPIDLTELAEFDFEEFSDLQKFNKIKQSRPDILPRTIAEIVKNPECLKITSLLNLKNVDGSPVLENSNVLVATSCIDENPDVSVEEFEARLKELQQKHIAIPFYSRSRIANHSEYEKIMKLLDLEKKIISNSDLILIEGQLEKNENVSVDDFVVRAIELREKRQNISASGLVKIANSSKYNDLTKLVELKEENSNSYLISDECLSKAVILISKNPDMSVDDFIKNLQQIKQKRPNILQDDLIEVAGKLGNDKFAELIDLLGEDNKPMFEDVELSYVASQLGTNSDISDEEYIERVRALKKKRPDNYDIFRLANHPECLKLLEVLGLKTEDNSYVFDDSSIKSMKVFFSKNPDVSVEDFAKRVTELKQKNLEISNYNLFKLANHSEYSKILDMQNDSDLNFSVMVSALVNNSGIKVDDFVQKYKEVKKQDFYINHSHMVDLVVHPEYSKILKLMGVESLLDFSSIFKEIGENPNVSVEEFIDKYNQVKEKEIDLSVSELTKLANHSEFENIMSLIEQGVEPNIAIKAYSNEKYLNLIKNSRNLTPKEVAFLALHTPIDAFDLSLTSKLGKEVITLLNTGVTNDIVQAFCLANKNILSGKSKLENITQESIPSELTHIMARKDNATNTNTSPIMYDKSTYKFDDGVFTFDGVNGKNAFSVELKKTTEADKTLLVVSNKEKNKGSETYISYNGVIARVKPPTLVEKDEKGNALFDEDGDFIIKSEKQIKAQDSLRSYARLCPEQVNVLSEAAQNFIVNIFEDNGECIIGKGLTLPNGEIIKSFDANNMSDSEIEKHYKEVLPKLGNNISIEDILRLMPQNAMISINPYTTDDVNMLYSIGVEWMSKKTNGQSKLWKMRVHTQDIKFIDDPKNWIYRLGYVEKNPANNQECEYYYDQQGNTFVKGSNNAETHVEARTEDKDGTFNSTLISNPHFQNIIRQIDKEINKVGDKKISNLGNLAQKLGIKIEKEETSDDDKTSKKIKPNEDEILIYSIIDKCYEDATLYAKYKSEIDKALADFGISLFSK